MESSRLSSATRYLQSAWIARVAAMLTVYKSHIGTSCPRRLIGRARSRGLGGVGDGVSEE